MATTTDSIDAAAASSSTVNYIDVFWHEGMLKHDAGKGVFDTGMDPGFLDVLDNHPENSDRVKNMLSILKRGPISPYISWNLGRPALIPELLSFHTSGTFSFAPINIASFFPIFSSYHFVLTYCEHIGITGIIAEVFSVCFLLRR